MAAVFLLIIYVNGQRRTIIIPPQAVVQRIEYDPNRSARIALVEYKSPSAVAGQPIATKAAYIIAPDGLKARPSA